MPGLAPIPKGVRARIDQSLLAYDGVQLQSLLKSFQVSVETNVRNSAALAPYIHSIKSRIKEPTHLRDKLERRYHERREKGLAFDVTPQTLVTTITDLVGIRILHLYTRQFESINVGLCAVLKEYKFKLVEKPFARTWDDEYREYFKGVGIRIEKSPSMYTSVHYVIASASETQLTCEIQVRTLMEEVWGEVDHKINYPHRHPSQGILEQLRTLARTTSAATRLVDCIFACEPELKVASMAKASSRLSREPANQSVARGARKMRARER